MKADIKRCLDMRDAYALLDYEDASIATCRLVLVHAMVSPQFLRAAPGRRFIAFVCTLQPQLVRVSAQRRRRLQTEWTASTHTCGSLHMVSRGVSPTHQARLDCKQLMRSICQLASAADRGHKLRKHVEQQLFAAAYV